MPRPAVRFRVAEWLAILVTAAWIGWVTAVAVFRRSSWVLAGNYVVVVIVGALGVVAGRWLARQERGRVIPVLALIVLWVFVSVAFRGGSGGAPLGYSNANAALALQLVAMSALLTWGAPRGQRRAPAALLVVAATSVAITVSQAGIALLPVVLVAALLGLRGVRRRWWPAAVGFVVVAAAGALGLWLASRSEWPAALRRALDPLRLDLWHDALGLWRTSPWVGAGPGAFREFSEYGADADLAQPHASLLQVGSELGAVGVTICLLLVVAVLVLASTGSASAGLIAVAAICALVIHSFVDHVLDFPAVWAAAGAVVGLASSEELDVAHRERPRPGRRG